MTRRSELDFNMFNKFNMAEIVDQCDILFITLDTLRYDAAQAAWSENRLTTLGPYLAPSGWECRHTPASFTYAAHHAFFSGFLPTQIEPGPHPRLFASRFAGSETTTEHTFVFDLPTLPQALSARGYRTICIGGTGFFNPSSSLGQVLPALFDEAHWSSELGVTNPQSAINQVALGMERLTRVEDQLAFLFMNISAIHQPNWYYGGETQKDTLETHTAALIAVDSALAPLFKLCQNRRKTFCLVCSDHGTAYGENGHFGHRLAHEVIWNVPYTEFML